jgi:hypothetical protein
MTSPNDPIVESDLEAYVDGALSSERRIEVEAFLSARPELAARVMTDLRVRDELRLAFQSTTTVRDDARASAIRLERALARPRQLRGVMRIASALLLVVAGWFLNDQLENVLSEVTIAEAPLSLNVGVPIAGGVDAGPNTYSVDRDSDGTPDGIAIDENEDGTIDRYRLSTQELSTDVVRREARQLAAATSFDVNGDGRADFGTIDQNKDGTVDWFEVLRPPG